VCASIPSFQESLNDGNSARCPSFDSGRGVLPLRWGRLGIKTDGFFEFGACPGGIIELLIGQSKMVAICGIVWGSFDRATLRPVSLEGAKLDRFSVKYRYKTTYEAPTPLESISS
jgi:hypothetical protein